LSFGYALIGHVDGHHKSGEKRKQAFAGAGFSICGLRSPQTDLRSSLWFVSIVPVEIRRGAQA
jgi:hypothetical protein